MEKKVSVIIPVYNVENFIERSIHSVIGQTYKNLEIILVDDGSTDLSGIICDKYAKMDSRIKVYHKQNGGQGSARNLGLDNSSGEYITFLDSDDYMELNCIQELVASLERGNYDVAISNYCFVSEEGDTLCKFTNAMDTVMNGYEVIEHMWNDEIVNIAPWAKLYRRRMWEEFRFEECYCEDSATMYKLYKKDMQFCFNSKSLVNYVIRSNSDVRLFTEKKLYMLDIYDEVVEYAKKNLPKRLINAAISKQIAVNFHLLAQLPYCKYKNVENKIIYTIKNNRRTVLLDADARFKNRAACLLSYLGVKNSIYVLRFIKKIKRSF